MSGGWEGGREGGERAGTGREEGAQIATNSLGHPEGADSLGIIDAT